MKETKRKKYCLQKNRLQGQDDDRGVETNEVWKYELYWHGLGINSALIFKFCYKKPTAYLVTEL